MLSILLAIGWPTTQSPLLAVHVQLGENWHTSGGCIISLTSRQKDYFHPGVGPLSFAEGMFADGLLAGQTPAPAICSSNEWLTNFRTALGPPKARLAPILTVIKSQGQPGKKGENSVSCSKS